jgi:hypothetical protein
MNREAALVIEADVAYVREPPSKFFCQSKSDRAQRA